MVVIEDFKAFLKNFNGGNQELRQGSEWCEGGIFRVGVTE